MVLGFSFSLFVVVVILALNLKGKQERLSGKCTVAEIKKLFFLCIHFKLLNLYLLFLISFSFS